jgi:hypothetical protein
MGRLPTPTEGLAVLVTAPTGADAGGWRGPYLDPAEVPRDPWGSAYVYDLRPDDPERPFTIHSRGPDGVSATAGTDADDVGLWAAPSSPGQDPGGAVLTGVVPKLLRGPFVLVVVLLVAVAWLRIYAGRAARQPELHAGGYVRRHLRRQRRRMAAGGSTSDTD